MIKNISIHRFQPSYENAFRLLHRECLAHYQLPAATQTQEDRVLSCLLTERHMSCLLAFNNEKPSGFATWGLNFPAGNGISLVMKELFVSPQARQLGVGKALLSALVDIARSEECVRFDWATDGTNLNAQAFYKSLKAPLLDKQNYRLSIDVYDEFQRSLSN